VLHVSLLQPVAVASHSSAPLIVPSPQYSQLPAALHVPFVRHFAAGAARCSSQRPLLHAATWHSPGVDAAQSAALAHAHWLFVQTLERHSEPVTHAAPTSQFGEQLAAQLAPDVVRVQATPAGHGFGMHGSVSQLAPPYPPTHAQP
jgi:hypothetical protein